MPVLYDDDWTGSLRHSILSSYPLHYVDPFVGISIHGVMNDEWTISTKQTSITFRYREVVIVELVE